MIVGEVSQKVSQNLGENLTRGSGGLKRPPLFLVAKLTQRSGCILLVLISDVEAAHHGFDFPMARELPKTEKYV